MSKQQEIYIDHEVRLRSVEESYNKLINKIDRMDDRIHNNFLVIIGLLFTSIVIPVALHAFKLM